jgi:2-polyprenyl-3-methyl-5-hydroxy-6-metoxy-1,4-benzoquinol methylase
VSVIALPHGQSPSPPATSAQIAQKAGLNERYVREWLAAMVTGRVVDYDAQSRTYSLPREHAAWLTRGTALKNMAVTAQFIPVLATAEEGIVESFHQGGGLEYADYTRFHDVMAEVSYQSVVTQLTTSVLPLVPGLVEALQLGINVLDLGCGQGRALLEMARVFPNSHFTGYDFEAGVITAAQAAAFEQGLHNVHFAARDAAQVDEVAQYDLICTFDAIHDQADPARVLSNIARALHPHGVYLMQDIRGSSYLEKNMDHPAAPLLYTISNIHCMSVSLAQGGAGLGTMWGEELAVSMVRDAGFASVEVKQLPYDIMNNYYIARKTLDEMK